MKNYLENVEKITLEIRSPRSTFRALCNAKIITEKEAETAMDMIVHRNMTTHIYKEETAEIISSLIPSYYELMESIVSRIKI